MVDANMDAKHITLVKDKLRGIFLSLEDLDLLIFIDSESAPDR